MKLLSRPQLSAINKKVCSNSKCSVMFSEASEQHRILWRSCEECDDWYSGDCFQLFLNDSFVCKKCS